MNQFQKIGFFTPLNEEILLYWEKTKHVEDGVLFVRADGEMGHYLFDGESLNDEPSHWMYLPKVENDS